MHLPGKINATNGYEPPLVSSHCTQIVHNQHGSPTEHAEDIGSMKEITTKPTDREAKENQNEISSKKPVLRTAPQKAL